MVEPRTSGPFWATPLFAEYVGGGLEVPPPLDPLDPVDPPPPQLLSTAIVSKAKKDFLRCRISPLRVLDVSGTRHDFSGHCLT
jgi:hypothetical protein